MNLVSTSLYSVLMYFVRAHVHVALVLSLTHFCFIPCLQDHIVATTLSILLNDRTLRGWEFLQRSGDTSSQLIADSAERYGLLLSEVLQSPIDNPEVIIRNNLGTFLFCDGSKLRT